MDKIDLRKERPDLWKASAKAPTMVDVPAMHFLMVDGEGDPNTSAAFQQAIEALYGLSYTLKFASKMGRGIDWKVMGIEGLWWADDPEAFRAGRKDEWRWTLLIAQPDVVTAEAVEAARETLRQKKNPAALDRVRLERFDEGLSAQMLHVGPYSEEGPTIERLHAFIRDEGYDLAGKHHEIYLSDPRRVAPEKLKTILRYPVE
ncbi:MAG: hypothetical protein AMK72_02255 [Planctomycetes bacterium SM23_25]|nr:MAG: hypothetical protein AMK72_02255 [Planctomycetes bacterium SM23_25]